LATGATHSSPFHLNQGLRKTDSPPETCRVCETLQVWTPA
jgi:hypothetical protein